MKNLRYSHILMRLICLAGLLSGFVVWADGDEDEYEDFTIIENETPLEPVFNFWRLTVDDGLPDNAVNAFLHDSQGFMWIGTANGLVRYDGYEFTLFEADRLDENALSHAFIHTLYEAADGRIWIGTAGGGISVFDPTTESFRSYRGGRNNTDGLEHDRIKVILQTSDGTIWLAGIPRPGLTKYNAADDNFSLYLPDTTNPQALQSEVHALEEAPDDKLWVGGRSVVALFDPETGLFKNYNMPIEAESQIRKIRYGAEGTLWVAGNRGLYSYDPDIDAFITRMDVTYEDDLYEFERGLFIEHLEFDPEGYLWLGTRSGIYVFDGVTNTIIAHHEPVPGNDNSLADEEIRALYLDRTGAMWIGTEDGGISVRDFRQKRFAAYTHDYINDNSISYGDVQALYVSDDNILWFGVEEVLHRLDLSTYDLKRYTIPVSEQAGHTILSIYQDHSGTVWVGLDAGHLYEFDPEEEELQIFEPFMIITDDAASGVRAIYEDEDHTLFVLAAHDGIYKIAANRLDITFAPLSSAGTERGPGGNNFDEPADGPAGPADLPYSNRPDTRNTEPGTAMGPAGPDEPPPGFDPSTPRDGPPPPRPGGIPDPVPPAFSFYPAGDSNFWLATNNGFKYFDANNGDFVQYRVRPELPTGADVVTNFILVDSQGILWVGSVEGLLRIILGVNEFHLYTMEHGLPSNSISGMVEVDDGSFWISTTNGISHFDPRTDTFRNYYRGDGLAGNVFVNNAFAQAEDGRIFFGGAQGLTAFYPEDVIDSGYQPEVVLTSFSLFNELVEPGEDSPLDKPIYLTDAITLDHTQNNLSFEFAALNYAFSEQNWYQYMLEGLDDDWLTVDSDRNLITYMNLPAGDYTLRIRATNKDGQWSENNVALALTMLPPWWETTPFRVAVALAGIALIALFIQFRLYNMRRRSRELETEVKRKTESLLTATEELRQSEMQLRRAKDAAETANRAKSAFLANMSHELRSPLNVILGFSQVTHRQRDLPAPVLENINTIIRSGEHLLTLINQVLDLSKVESGRMELDQVDFDLYRLLDDLEDMFALSAERKRINLVFERDADVPRGLNTDELKLRQILINLINNAIKFTDEGTVTVRVSHINTGKALPEKQVRLKFAVIDTGAGIAPHELDELFSAFTQTATGKRVGEGTGLGLALSHQFVRILGDDLKVQSAVGEGTIFSFEVTGSVVDDLNTLIQDEREIRGLKPGQPEQRILIVDDKWTNRQLLRQLLEPAGFVIYEAENGALAVEMASAINPHLIWMDIRMPVMTGLEATKRIKATEHGEDITIIALTASVFEEEQTDILEAGCEYFLRKPFRAHQIFDLCHEFLGVEYDYIDDDLPEEREALSYEELVAAIATITRDKIDGLAESTEIGDVDAIDKHIQKLHTEHPAIAASLSQMADRFDYDAMLAVLREAQI